MKRLPLVLATMIMVFLAGLAAIPLFLLWLLGANKPFKNFCNTMNEIVFDKI
jgi:hypothetical protein